MSASLPASPDNIELPSLMQSLTRRMRGVIVVSSLAAGLTYLVCSGIAPRYASEAQLQIVAKGDAKPDGGMDAVAVRMDKEAINTHVRALMAPDLVSRIAEDMHLGERREFNSELGSVDMVSSLLRQAGVGGPRPGESEQDRVLATINRQLEVYAAKETRSIGIRFTSVDPDLAADFANSLAESYRQSLASQRGAETVVVNKELEARIGPLTDDVVAAEAEVERFRGQANIFRGAQNTGLNEQQLGDLTAELSRAKSERSSAEAKAKSARDLSKAGSADVLPDVQKSPMMQNILQQRVRLERQISELSATLLPEHPRMRQLNADLAGLKKQVAGEVGKLVEGFEKEAKMAAAREDAVKKSIDEIKSRVVSSGGDEVKLRQLEAVAKAKRAELERLQAQFEASRTRTEASAATVEAQIVSKARASSVPLFPKKSNYTALVFATTFLLGLALALVRAAIAAARPVRSKLSRTRSGDKQQAGDKQLAAAIADAAGADDELPLKAAKGGTPRSANASTAASAGKPAAQQAPAASAVPAAAPAGDPVLGVDSIARIITELPHQATGFRTIVVGETDSVDPGLEAVEIALGVAESGKGVVVVEWSPSGRSMAADLDLPAMPGMNQLVTGTASFEQVVTSVPGTDVHFIPAGVAIGDDTAIVDPDLVNLLLDALDEAYEHIIVVGHHSAARQLFEAILGRFDAGVTVGAEGSNRLARQPEGVFLGFEVTDITLMRHQRGAVAVAAPAAAPAEPARKPAQDAAVMEAAVAKAPAPAAPAAPAKDGKKAKAAKGKNAPVETPPTPPHLIARALRGARTSAALSA